MKLKNGDWVEFGYCYSYTENPQPMFTKIDQIKYIYPDGIIQMDGMSIYKSQIIRRLNKNPINA